MILTRKTVALDHLLLDPNNPRFADISDESLNIAPTRFHEQEIQDNAYSKMMQARFDVHSLADSIETVGFVPVDSIVARDLGNSYYVVIEGNRRTTALKYLVKQYNLGQSAMMQEAIDAIKEVSILVVDESEDDSDQIGKVIQGIRNVSGIKEWEAYQKSQFVSDMMEKGRTPGTIGKMIGMSVREVSRYYKTFNAISQFRRDEEFGGKWKNSYFSYFDEVLKRPALRNFFGWDEDEAVFMNDDNYKRFYDWITPNEEGETTITDAHDVRSLVDFLDEPKALAYLDDRNLEKARHYIALKNKEKDKLTLQECINRIDNAVAAFKSLIGEGLEAQMTSEDVEELSGRIQEMAQQVQRIKTLKSSEPAAI